MSTPSIVDVLLEDAELIATDAVEALRREVPAILAATSPDLLHAGIRGGVRRFAAVWQQDRDWEPAEIQRLVAPTLALHGALDREDALHAMRVIVEVCRQHEARRYAAQRDDPEVALSVLRQAETARRLSSVLIDEVDTALHRADRGSGRARDRVDDELLALLLDRPAAPHVAANHAREHGIDLSGAWVVAVCDLPEDDDHIPVIEPRSVERERLLIGRRGSYIVVAAREAAVEQLRLPPVLGLSRTDSLGQFRDAFDEALAALSVSRRCGAPKTYENALVDLVLLGTRPSSVLSTKLMEELDDPDPDRTAWLLDTLEAYLEEATCVTAAARRLNMHRESFRYRLQQLDARLGEQLGTPEGRLGLQMAVRAIRIEAGC